MKCPLCKKSEVLLETELTVVIANLYPATKGHLLVLPKRHVPNISELTLREGNDLFNCLRIAREKIKKHLCPQGLNVFLNEGQIAGQTLEHLHWHVIPRMENDGLENFKRRQGERSKITENERIELIKFFK